MTTVYITHNDTTLSKLGDRIIVRQDGKEVADLPVIKVDQIVIFGNASLSAQLITMLLDAGIPVTYLTFNGRFRGRLLPHVSKNSLLRKEQFRASLDKNTCCYLAASFVKGKLTNMRNFILRNTRGERTDQTNEACGKIKMMIDKLPFTENMDEIRGIEGMGTKYYFKEFAKLLNDEKGMTFTHRNKRPPRDPVNALLSFCYVMLYNEIQTALYIVGFDPYIGYLHADKYGKPSLALDLMEEFRAPVADSLVVSLINKGMVAKENFKENEIGAIEMTESTLKKVVQSFEKKLRSRIKYSLLEETITMREIMEKQARILGKYLTGEIDHYPPYTLR